MPPGRATTAHASARSGRVGDLGAATRTGGVLTAFAEDLQELLAVALKLRLANAIELEQLRRIAGSALDHLQQGGVVEDDVGRHVVGSRELLAASAQSIPKGAVGFGHRRQ